MEYKIVATLGPACDNATMWKAMLDCGVTDLRLNTSHLSLSQLHGWLERLAPFIASVQPRPHLVLDLQASKWRLGEFQSFVLVCGQKIELVHAATSARTNVLPVPHADFFEAAAVSNKEIVLNDAKIILERESVVAGAIVAVVIQGGEISSRKGITYMASSYRAESLSCKDQSILDATRSYGLIRYALSYVKDAAEMARYRALFGRSAYLIAKIERRAAVDELQQIAALADELWVCRGDLGAELGIAGMARTVHQISSAVRTLPVPVHMAGQVLEHMTTQPTPTRSEVCFLHDALMDGYSGIVLSDETAIGRHPVESCRIASLFSKLLPNQ